MLLRGLNEMNIHSYRLNTEEFIACVQGQERGGAGENTRGGDDLHILQLLAIFIYKKMQKKSPHPQNLSPVFALGGGGGLESVSTLPFVKNKKP